MHGIQQLLLTYRHERFTHSFTPAVRLETRPYMEYHCRERAVPQVKSESSISTGAGIIGRLDLPTDTLQRGEHPTWCRKHAIGASTRKKKQSLPVPLPRSLYLGNPPSDFSSRKKKLNAAPTLSLPCSLYSLLVDVKLNIVFNRLFDSARRAQC